jgi:hypothetical protein
VDTAELSSSKTVNWQPSSERNTQARANKMRALMQFAFCLERTFLSALLQRRMSTFQICLSSA